MIIIILVGDNGGLITFYVVYRDRISGIDKLNIKNEKIGISRDAFDIVHQV